MRPVRLLVPVLALPALALAQDSAPPDPVGTVLHDALPPGADLVVHVPSVPKFLESALDAGFGTAEAWRDAFRRQLSKWGGDEAERLTRGAETLLRLAVGEALVASMELPRLGSPTAPRTRAWVVALRSRATEKQLRAAVDDVVTGGLLRRFPDARTDQSMGRSLLALSGPFDGVWIRAEDHLVAISDHPLALGLLFRGLERVARENRPPDDVSSFKLRVRWGRADSPARWEGSTFLQREAVSAGTKVRSRGAAALPADGAVLAFVVDEAGDVPVFPVRVPDSVAEQAKAMSARPLAMRLLADGTFTVAGSGAASDEAKPLLGAATRGGWLRALAEGRIESPFALDAAALAAPLAAIDAAKPEVSPPVAEWRPGSDEGEVRGPAWHGPVTFLALRTLRDIAWRTAPDTPPPPAPEPPPKPAEAAPPRGLNAPGTAPVKPVQPLPVPEEK
jgi:hypothetical protein